MTRAALKAAAPALCLAGVVLLPFLGKAFTIDDTLFLRQAQQLFSDPRHPTAFEMVWSESPAPVRMSAIMPSGPAMAYLLTPCIASGGDEWIAHVVVMLLFALAILATAALALRLGLDAEGARAASLLLAATPAALGMAGTAMPDVPAMAFGVLGMERLLAWRSDRGWVRGAVATLSLVLAALARSHLILLVGVGALALPRDFLSWRRWKETSPATWLPLVAVPLLTLAAVVWTADPGASPAAVAGAARKFSSIDNLGRNLTAFATHWSLALPLALPWAVLRWRVLLRNPVLYIGVVAAGALLLADGEARRVLVVAAAAGLGAAVLWDVLADGWRRRDATQLVLGLTLLMALPVAFYLHMPSKYLLASAPAAAILVARACATRSDALSRTVLAATVVVGLGLGVLIVRADAAFAALGRRAAAEWIAPQVAAGQRVWFAGHWGFQWYAEKAGARFLTAAPPRPARGDLAVSSQNSLGYSIQMFKRRRLATIEDTTPGGRIMDRNAGCGFFSNDWGYLPWSWGHDALDRYSLWQLE